MIESNVSVGLQQTEVVSQECRGVDDAKDNDYI